jgi:hypothetical protein
VQVELRRVPWLVFQADNYSASGLFLVPRHERELARMFPRRDAGGGSKGERKGRRRRWTAEALDGGGTGV